jgi:predicted nucleotidyltransferase
MSAYLDHIQSYARLYRSIPFVEQIYLCNSITFNALHEGSDIDILIITKPGMLWLARARSWLMFTII